MNAHSNRLHYEQKSCNHNSIEMLSECISSFEFRQCIVLLFEFSNLLLKSCDFLCVSFLRSLFTYFVHPSFYFWKLFFFQNISLLSKRNSKKKGKNYIKKSILIVEFVCFVGNFCWIKSEFYFMAEGKFICCFHLQSLN